MDTEQLLKEKLGAGFDGAIAARIGEFGGLLSRAAAVRLLCKQNGIDVEETLPLSKAASAHLPFTFRAKVSRIFPLQTYPNRRDRSVRLHLSDGSWEATLVLWNEQADLVEGHVSSGDTIECHGAYARGGEIWVGRNGSITTVEAGPIMKIEGLTAGACNVEGEVGEVEPDYAYVDKKSGQERKLSSFQLCSGRHCRRVVVWPGDASSAPFRAEQGDVLLLENVVFKNNEIHFNSYSRMVRKKSAQEKEGVLASAHVEGGEAVLTLGGKAFRLPLDDALRLLGVLSIPEGVSPETLFWIKSSEACGKMVKYSLEENRLAWLSIG
jgi:hypothetical protein